MKTGESKMILLFAAFVVIVVVAGSAFIITQNKGTNSYSIGSSTSNGATSSSGTVASCTSGQPQYVAFSVWVPNYSAQPISSGGTNGYPNASVASTVNLYGTGSATLVSTTTLTSGYNTSSYKINCGANYRIVGGDDSTYYEESRSFGSGLNATTQAGLLLWKNGAPTITAANASSSAQATNSVFHSVSTSSIVNTELFNIRAGNATYGDPSYGFLTVFLYNSLAVSTISWSGVPTAAQKGITLPNPTYSAPGQNNQVGFVIPSIYHYQYALVGGSSALSPTIQTTSSALANTVLGGSMISICTYPIVNYNNAGAWYPGVVVNPTTSGTSVFGGTCTTNYLELSSN